jgi:C-terminal processing protease CtpA/Prc
MGAVIIWQDGAVVVTSVNPFGPAGASGEVLVGDHIVEVGGKAVTSVDQARALILGPGISSLQLGSLAPLLWLIFFLSGKQVRAETQAQHISCWV